MTLRLPRLPLLAAVSWLLSACGEEPIVLGPSGQVVDQGLLDQSPSPGAGGTGGNMPPPTPTGGAGGTGGVGGSPAAEIEPDFDLFQSTVVGLLYSGCGGPACHASAAPSPSDTLFHLVQGGPDQLTPEQQMVNFRESLAFVDFAEPAQSELLVHHPPEFPAYVIPGSGTYNRIIEWIEDALVPPEPVGAGGMGGEGGTGGDGGSGGSALVPCEGLPPPGSPAGRSQGYRDAYGAPDADGASINDMLVSSCGEAGACHGTQGVGGGYWLLRDIEDPCAIQWNYLVSQWFIDALMPDTSLLLTKPRERDHGGRVVFRGRDDPRHVRLLLWIENEFTR